MNDLDLALAHEATLAQERAKPLQRRRLRPGEMAMLIALRLYVAAAVPVIGYGFLEALSRSH
jgi:hypothetical protein